MTTESQYPLVDRLRCNYAGRDFSGPAPQGTMLPTGIMLEAAAEIERLQGLLAHTEAEVSTISEALAEATAEADHWKANHKDMADRNRVLLQRPDLDVTRIPIYEKLKDERDKALAALAGQRHSVDHIDKWISIAVIETVEECAALAAGWRGADGISCSHRLDIAAAIREEWGLPTPKEPTNE